MSEVMIRVDNLTKDYGSFRAVDGVSFDVHKGEVLGFLGPNGAGKSTTMKMLTCFIAPTGGTATVAGKDVFEQSLAVRQNIGYLPEDTPLYRDMTVSEYLHYAGEVRGMSYAQRRERIKSIGARCGLEGVAGKLVSELSRGFRQRTGLAAAMIHDPDILILDEPTSGLDPNQIVEIRQLIKEVGQEKTVILSTHILPEVQATCSRIVIISGGKLVADGTPESLQAAEKGASYRIVLNAEGAVAAQVRETVGQINGVTGCQETDGEKGTLTLDVLSETPADLRTDLFQAAVSNQWPLLELRRESASLEDVFRHLTRGEGAQ